MAWKNRKIKKKKITRLERSKHYSKQRRLRYENAGRGGVQIQLIDEFEQFQWSTSALDEGYKKSQQIRLHEHSREEKVYNIDKSVTSM